MKTYERQWHRIGQVNDFPEDRKTLVKVLDKEVLILHRENTWYAFENNCPHLGLSLQDSPIEAGTMTCKAHNIQFDITSGRIIDSGGHLFIPRLTVFSVKIENDEVFIQDKGSPNF